MICVWPEDPAQSSAVRFVEDLQRQTSSPLPSVCGVPNTNWRSNRWTVSPARNVKNMRSYVNIRQSSDSAFLRPAEAAADEPEVGWPTPLHDVDISMV